MQAYFSYRFTIIYLNYWGVTLSNFYTLLLCVGLMKVYALNRSLFRCFDLRTLLILITRVFHYYLGLSMLMKSFFSLWCVYCSSGFWGKLSFSWVCSCLCVIIIKTIRIEIWLFLNSLFFKHLLSLNLAFCLFDVIRFWRTTITLFVIHSSFIHPLSCCVLWYFILIKVMLWASWPTRTWFFNDISIHFLILIAIKDIFLFLLTSYVILPLDIKRVKAWKVIFILSLWDLNLFRRQYIKLRTLRRLCQVLS